MRPGATSSFLAPSSDGFHSLKLTQKPLGSRFVSLGQQQSDCYRLLFSRILLSACGGWSTHGCFMYCKLACRRVKPGQPPKISTNHFKYLQSYFVLGSPLNPPFPNFHSFSRLKGSGFPNRGFEPGEGWPRGQGMPERIRRRGPGDQPGATSRQSQRRGAKRGPKGERQSHAKSLVGTKC